MEDAEALFAQHMLTYNKVEEDPDALKHKFNNFKVRKEGSERGIKTGGK